MRDLKLVVNNKQRKRDEKIFFVRKEFKTILNLYARMVSNGSWKDYSLSSSYKEVSFDIYRRSSEKPFLRISKNLSPKSINKKYLIKDKNGNVIQKSENLRLLINKISWNNLKLVK